MNFVNSKFSAMQLLRADQVVFFFLLFYRKFPHPGPLILCRVPNRLQKANTDRLQCNDASYSL